MSDFFSILFLIALLVLSAFGGKKKRPAPRPKSPPLPQGEAPGKLSEREEKKALDYMLRLPAERLPQGEDMPPAPLKGAEAKVLPSRPQEMAAKEAPVSLDKAGPACQKRPSWRAAFISSVVFGPPRSKQDNKFNFKR